MDMKNNILDISGGATVRKGIYTAVMFGRRARAEYGGHRRGLYLVPFLLLLICPSIVMAQGSIFGTVTNSNATVPGNGQVLFYGFLGDTDDEIRLESSVGAGYDAGNWFDDFQNYLDEAAGRPYDYYFYNLSNGESAVLSKTIPSNSFQQENIALVLNSGLPVRPAGLSARVVSATSAVISWNRVGSYTYHIYRRLATSTGSFFRIDDPTGSLANVGVADSFFVDNTIDGVSEYQYLVIPQNGVNNLGPHSEILTVNSALISAPVVTAVTPNNGAYIGGTPVAISGVGFDRNGATVTFDGVALTSVTVVSPYRITGITPAGTVGIADIVVRNTAAGLNSNTLVGGFTYNPNTAPILAAIGPRTGTEGVLLTFAVSASDPDGTTPTLSATPLPTGATFVDNGNGTGTFSWTPTFTQAGPYQVTFTAADGIETDNELVSITINDAGNQLPVLAAIGPQTVAENATLNLNLSATDADLNPITFSTTAAPANSNLTDNGDGTALFTFTPDFTQAGIYNVVFKAFDGTAVDSEVVAITVTNTNQPPILAAIGAQTGPEGILLTFVVNASDLDGNIPTLAASPLPSGATFVDNLNGTGTFTWTPTFVQSGVYPVTFTASDGTATDDEIVTVTITDPGNQPPVLAAIGPRIGTEGILLTFGVSASDADGTIPTLSALNLPTGATFVDNLDGTGTFSWTPAFNAAGPYQVTFQASDGSALDEEIVDITINESGNQPPTITPIDNVTINENDSTVVVVNAFDPDGAGVYFTLSTAIPPAQYSFVDSGNGVGVFIYHTNYMSAGARDVVFFATDLASPPATAQELVTIQVIDVNRPPVIAPIGPFGVRVGRTLTFNVAASDSTDPNLLHHVFMTAMGVPANATFVDNGNSTGTFTFTPTLAQVGPYTVTFMATDQGSPILSAQLAVAVNVVAVNQEPVWVDPPQYLFVTEGEVLTQGFTATDPEGGTLSLYSIKLPPNASFTDNGGGTGTLSFSPNYVQAGLVQVVLAAYDGIDETRTDPIIVQVIEAGNQAPVFPPIPTQTVTEGQPLTFAIAATDPDGTTPQLAAETLPANMTFTDNGNGTATIIFNPNFVQAGTYDITIVATDGALQTTVIVTVEVIEAGNQPPALNSVANQTVNEMQTLAFRIFATDPDLDIPDLSALAMPSGATFVDSANGAGGFIWVTDNFAAGTYLVSFIARDPNNTALYDSIEVQIIVNNVNQAPYPFIPNQTRTVNEGNTLTYVVYALDPDGTDPHIVINSPTYSLATNMTWVDSGNGTGVLTFTPSYTQGASTPGIQYYLQWVVVDAEDPNLTALTTPPTQFTVLNTNRAPILSTTANSLDTTMLEGQTMAFQLSATDPDAQPVNIIAENLPINSTFGGISFIRQFSFTPDFTQAGVYSPRFIATDGSLTDTIIVQITVLDAGNQPPGFAGWNTITAPDVQPVVIGESHTTVLRALDPDFSPLDMVLTWLDGAPSAFTFTDSGNGMATMTISPQASELGTFFPAQYVASDGFGLADTILITYVAVEFLRGDANSDGGLDMSDIMYIINDLFKSGPAPASYDAADVNFDETYNILDAEFLIRYFYKQGPPPPGQSK